ncbi:hypothetical protein QOM21_37090 [Streptomyces sp. Pv4-95]|uniref:hypothetical protein n=1 Tax=Streptomyces sp. Pv4-95 TaxID=3049543 RepID=UPI003892BC54
MPDDIALDVPGEDESQAAVDDEADVAGSPALAAGLRADVEGEDDHGEGEALGRP